MNIARALTIAGSDSGGGAGIQADLKTFQELDVFGMSVITAVTAQNTQEVKSVHPVPVEGVEEQLQAIADDIHVDAVKTGMLYDEERICVIAEQIKKAGWKKVVVDPVMVATTGMSLFQKRALSALIEYMVPLATILTPNIPEAEVLTDRKIETLDDRKEAARQLVDMGAKSVIIKGGHQAEGEHVIDVFYDGESYHTFERPRVETTNTHGTGCTFASAIAANLAQGKEIFQAVEEGKAFIHTAIEHALDVGHGHGPTNHAAWRFQGK
ncbi:bifunctional hydroxymethylpyrimidine kinase/phosphomethylpyrimidine kinase [Texcoconibacillus texcoconensis]|uniref:Hydroxymethylpyrimidine/phosphomethylpyrimidine kinase n=1 Tax=Texcoconibacillus texcoconensis TaxID=1095777 RepID=A0A840QQ03_9BACI|nr:bifunctional hydroxymethylpyrimidine kinase/phosphomethylpyrimidine kinase [Texcoconibacillus texcoconensis]MBB5173496.1 hydroxymethylpyrimidine/phosphomethylpyrimidine kinase [Texcoconibacillus texcoconensis]